MHKVLMFSLIHFSEIRGKINGKIYTHLSHLFILLVICTLIDTVAFPCVERAQLLGIHRNCFTTIIYKIFNFWFHSGVEKVV